MTAHGDTPGPPENPSLYVHVPFCVSRCGYCTFVSSPYAKSTADAYLAALEREANDRRIRDTPFATLFIGGGTPSSLSPAQLARLLDILPPVAGEATCELNPDSATPEKLRILRERGVNRVSFGVQTFSPVGLRLLERRHDASQAIRAVETAAEIGFPRGISIDLINSWPGQQLADIRNDIEISVKLYIQHLSYYALIPDPSAPRYANYAEHHDDDGEAERLSWDFIEESIGNNGFIHYETSNFSHMGFPCAHNVAIWRGGEYFGLGPGAHSHVAGRRFANCSDVNEYIQCSDDAARREVFSERLEGEDKARECAVFWLRLFDGVELDAFQRKTGFAFEDLYRCELPELLREGIMEQDNNRIRVSRRYQPLLDMVLTDLV